MRVDRFSPFTYGRDIKVSPQDPNTLYACLSVAASSKDGALYRSQDVGKSWQRFDKVTPHGTLMSVGLHHGDAKQVYVAARYGEVFGTQDGGESWLEMPLPQGVQNIYALACGASIGGRLDGRSLCASQHLRSLNLPSPNRRRLGHRGHHRHHRGHELSVRKTGPNPIGE
jgi:hypothetical protein